MDADQFDAGRGRAPAEHSQRLFRALYNSPLIFGAVLAPDGTVRSLNETAVDATGADPRSCLGGPFWELPWWPAVGGPDIEGLVDRAAAGETVQYRTRFEAAGEERTALGAMLPVEEDGEVRSVLAVGQDVTDDARYLRAALDTVEQLFFVFDEDLRLREYNATVPAVTGYPDERLRGATPELFIAEPDVERVGRAISEVLDTGEAIVEADLETADGGRIPYEFRGSRLPLVEDIEPGFVGIGYDITERRRRERALERRNERLDEFASLVSHDLRNPLNVAQGRLRLLAEQLDVDDDNEHLAAVERAHDRMADLIGDLLALARGNGRELEPEALSLAELTRHCWRTVDAGGADLVVDGDATLRADRSRLKQLLENLFSNAVEHGGDRIRVGPTADGFYVADDGPGIPPEDRERVFEDGYSTSDAGTGLGLRIVREVAGAHGWSVTAGESREGGVRIEVSGAREKT
jgi:PAS domain S-box-containing protein